MVPVSSKWVLGKRGLHMVPSFSISYKSLMFCPLGVDIHYLLLIFIFWCRCFLCAWALPFLSFSKILLIKKPSTLALAHGSLRLFFFF
jgi:hypothetical protein